MTKNIPVNFILYEVMKKNAQFIEIETNLKLWIETYGYNQNEAVLFISGAGANSSFWSERLCEKLLQENFFVIKYDHRDFGYSSKIDFEQNPYDVLQLAKDALTILDSFNIKKAHLVGHSMGGGYYAVNSPKFSQKGDINYLIILVNKLSKSSAVTRQNLGNIYAE